VKAHLPGANREAKAGARARPRLTDFLFCPLAELREEAVAGLGTHTRASVNHLNDHYLSNTLCEWKRAPHFRRPGWRTHGGATQAPSRETGSP
jgi:hypothetical protein